MKPTVLQLGPLHPLVEKGLAERYTRLNLGEAKDPKAFLAEHAAAIDAVVSSSRNGVNAALIDSLPNLRMVSHFGVGYDNVDAAHAKQRGVAVSNTPDVLTDCVADLAIALMIDVARGLTAGDRYVRRGEWPKGPMPLAAKVSGKRLGILGLGRIGQAIAKRAEGFGMAIRYHNRKPVPGAVYGYEPTVESLAAHCDFLMVATSGGGATRGLVSRAVLDALGPRGFVVNIARGSVIDEPAILEYLREKKIAGAALDVFVDEPRVPEGFCALENVVLAPHIASATVETRAAMANLVLENLDRFFETGQPVTPV
jgi:lactate dehydrogenase-like 2-hydroxyacid dehydrogenase